MFNDEDSIAFKKMHGFSAVDGFVEITEGLADMIKYVANEPSVGLFYVQQHIQNAAPNLVNLKNKVVETSRETNLHSEDLEDSIAMVSSMKECGLPIADEMTKAIKKSLSIVSKRQPKRGLINSKSSGFNTGRMSSWSPKNWGHNVSSPQQKSDGYLSSVFKTAKQTAGSFTWARAESEESSIASDEKLMSYVNPATLKGDGEASSSAVLEESENSQEESQLDRSLFHQELLSLAKTYDEFKADKEAKLEEWLGETSHQEGHGDQSHPGSALVN